MKSPPQESIATQLGWYEHREAVQAARIIRAEPLPRDPSCPFTIGCRWAVTCQHPWNTRTPVGPLSIYAEEQPQPGEYLVWTGNPEGHSPVWSAAEFEARYEPANTVRIRDNTTECSGDVPQESLDRLTEVAQEAEERRLHGPAADVVTAEMLDKLQTAADEAERERLEVAP